jgi:hypothetical protein
MTEPVASSGEIEEALTHFGLRLRGLTPVSPLGTRKGRRRAYRVECEDGRTVKVRQVDSVEDARRLCRLRAGLEEAFAPVLAQHGPVLLEEWIEGVPLSGVDAEARLEEAGALLGRLHARALDPDEPVARSTRGWVSRAMSDLEILATAGKLAPAEVKALRGEILRRDPGEASSAVIHRDFCAENMVIDAGGRLRIIDNEQMHIGPAGFDLGRTYDRWPMTAHAWERFRRGYRGAADEVEALGFWKIAAALVGARVRLQRSPHRLDAVLSLLRRFAAGCDLEALR